MNCRRAAVAISIGYRTDAAGKKVGIISSTHLCNEPKEVFDFSPQSLARGMRVVAHMSFFGNFFILRHAD